MSEATAAADLLFRPVDELAGMVRSGEIGSRELVQASLDRIEELDPKLNAFVDQFGEEALAAADGVAPGDERPLAGVPVAIKNNRAVEGKRLTWASDLAGDFLAPHDHNVVRRLKEAGAIVVGTTTLPEYGYLNVTETKRFGVTRNPWDIDRTPGGSSGGSAAAVASGMLPFAHANDGGGSTRIPAACCGLVGLKPQRGRISMAPEVGEQFLAQDGVLTRTVRETALLLDILAGPELGDASWAQPPAEPFAEAAAREPGTLRIGLTTVAPLDGIPIQPAQADAVRRTGELLESLGHHVEEATPPWPVEGMLQTFTALFAPMNSLQAAFAGTVTGREPSPEHMESLSWWMFETATTIDALTAQWAMLQMQGHGRTIVAWASQYDAVVLPVTTEPPVPIGTIDGDGPDPAATFRRSGQFTPYPSLFNVSGQPAISLPLFEEDGLPVAVQIAGQPAQEGPLLALAAQLEAARPWADRRPPVS
jgi:amidase